MKAAILKNNAEIQINEVEVPELEKGQCRVRMRYVGVCSSDIARGFQNGAYFYPLIMGHEMSGQIVEVSNDVTDFKPGDNVVVFPLKPCFECEACQRKAYVQCHDYSYYGSRENGGYAEYLNVDQWNLITLPEGIDLKDAASTEPLAVVLHALNSAQLLEPNNLEQSKTICIIGSGFLGLLMAQILSIKAPQYNLTVIDRNAFKLDIAKKYAANTIRLASKDDWHRFLEKNNSSYDVVYEATGNHLAFGNSIILTKQNGTLVWMGNIDDDLTISKKTVSSVLRKEIKIIGTWNSIYKNGDTDDWLEAIRLIESGVYPSELVTDLIALDEVSDILNKMNRHKTGQEKFENIKAMITFDG